MNANQQSWSLRAGLPTRVLYSSQQEGITMIRTLVSAGMIAAAAVLGGNAPDASAIPWPGGDPHIPNPPAWCYKGFGNYFCDGMPYEDGSFWHAVPQPLFGRWDISCRKPSGNLLIVDPAPGGCGGEG